MRAVRRGAGLAGLTLLLAAPVAAQTPECEGYSSNTRRVCDAAVDATRAFHPLAGLLVSGGNPVLGTGGPLGGLGHLSVTARANGLRLVLPDLEYNGSSETVPSDEEVFVAAPLVEAAVGVYPGLSSGFLGIDLLGSAHLLPTDQIDNLRVDRSARRIGNIALGLGYGARIGLLREWGPLPGLSVSIMRRDIPEISYGDLGEGDGYAYAVDLHATNLRLVASKRVVFLDLAAGLGWDRYTGDAVIQFADPLTGFPEEPIPLELESSRIMGFLNAGLDLSVLRLVGELGYQGGRDQQLTTEFEDFDPNEGKFFAGLGLRVSF